MNPRKRDPDDPDPRPPPSFGTSGKSSGSSARRYSGRGEKSGRNSGVNRESEYGSYNRPAKQLKESKPDDIESKIGTGAAAADNMDDSMTDWLKEYETWKDITCACGFGYYTIQGEWISGADVRARKAPPRPINQQISLKVCK
jgi:hypothetical protein